jgi:hypothetical protein
MNAKFGLDNGRADEFRLVSVLPSTGFPRGGYFICVDLRAFAD